MTELNLTSLGLRQNETKAYETLLQLGKASAAQISKQSSVPYGRIYDVLASLEHKHLITIVPESTRKYIPTDPEKLHEYITNKKKKLDEAEAKIKEFRSIYKQHEQPPVEVVTGKGTFYKINRSLPIAKKRAYSIKYAFDDNPEIIREVRDIHRRGVDHCVLGRFDKETKKNVQKWKKIDPHIKQIDNEGVVMSLTDDELVLIVLIQSNTTILIRDKPFIDLMAKLFKFYYDHH